MECINISLNKEKLFTMSNAFKTNSRFAALNDDIPAKKEKKDDKKKTDNKVESINDKIEVKPNTFKSEKPLNDNSRFNSFKNDGFKNDSFRDRRYNRFDERDSQRRREQYEAEEKARIEFENKEKERKKQEALQPENFPDLVIQSNKIKDENIEVKQNYIEKIKKSQEEIKAKKSIDEDFENLKPGWIMIKRDPVTGQLIRKGKIEEDVFPEKTEQEIGLDIVNALVSLHERRTQEYIELYGYDTWEKMFKFPDWREREAEMEDESDDEEDEYDNGDEEDEYDEEY